jgi:hypothetical protein
MLTRHFPSPAAKPLLKVQEATPIMKELIRSNDLVLLSYIEALLKEAAIPHEMADEHMSAVVGSIDASPRRLLVKDEDWARAREIVDAADADHTPSNDT